MEVWVVLAIVSVVAAAVVYFLWPKAKHVDIKAFPRKFPDEKVNFFVGRERFRLTFHKIVIVTVFFF